MRESNQIFSGHSLACSYAWCHGRGRKGVLEEEIDTKVRFVVFLWYLCGISCCNNTTTGHPSFRLLYDCILTTFSLLPDEKCISNHLSPELRLPRTSKQLLPEEELSGTQSTRLMRINSTTNLGPIILILSVSIYTFPEFWIDITLFGHTSVWTLSYVSRSWETFRLSDPWIVVLLVLKTCRLSFWSILTDYLSSKYSLYYPGLWYGSGTIAWSN